ncbi:hypothetical protein JOM56_012210 [Amanita muscaria]
MPITAAPSNEEILALSAGFNLGADLVPEGLTFVYSRNLKGSVLVSQKAVDEPFEVWGVFKISRDSFSFTPTAGYDMVNKPVYDRDKSDDACWLALRPAVNLLAHSCETMLGDSAKGAGANKQHDSLVLENWGLKLAHKFLVEAPASEGSDHDSDAEEGASASKAEVPFDLTLEGWPVPDTWSEARQALIDRNYAIQPLNAFVHNTARPIRPSRYEQRLKGAITHVSFMVLAYKFERDGCIRFSAVARKITVLVPPASVAAASSAGKEKQKSPDEASGSGSKKPSPRSLLLREIEALAILVTGHWLFASGAETGRRACAFLTGTRTYVFVSSVRDLTPGGMLLLSGCYLGVADDRLAEKLVWERVGNAERLVTEEAAEVAAAECWTFFESGQQGRVPEPPSPVVLSAVVSVAEEDYCLTSCAMWTGPSDTAPSLVDASATCVGVVPPHVVFADGYEQVLKKVRLLMEFGRTKGSAFQKGLLVDDGQLEFCHALFEVRLGLSAISKPAFQCSFFVCSLASQFLHTGWRQRNVGLVEDRWLAF